MMLQDAVFSKSFLFFASSNALRTASAVTDYKTQCGLAFPNTCHCACPFTSFGDSGKHHNFSNMLPSLAGIESYNLLTFIMLRKVKSL